MSWRRGRLGSGSAPGDAASRCGNTTAQSFQLTRLQPVLMRTNSPLRETCKRRIYSPGTTPPCRVFPGQIQRASARETMQRKARNKASRADTGNKREPRKV
jgi:hypothetical protein